MSTNHDQGDTIVFEWASAEKISHSTWASRGWTLQESYLSKRRLFFTDRQVIFACNTEILYEHATEGGALDYLNGIIGPDFDESSVKGYALQNLMETYSRRQLRYHDDAFNAISGLLRYLTGPGTFYAHLWGVPVYVSYMNNYRGHKEERVCLEDTRFLWTSTTLGTYREGFPSWSPLGWTSHMSFNDAKITPTGRLNLRFWAHQSWTLWRDLTRCQFEALWNRPSDHLRFLRMSISTFTCRLSWNTSTQSCSICVNDYLVEPQWDGTPSELGLGETIICAPIEGRFPGISSRLLLLRPSRLVLPSDSMQETPTLPVYERVGSIDHHRMFSESGSSWTNIDLKKANFSTEVFHMRYGFGGVDMRDETFILA